MSQKMGTLAAALLAFTALVAPAEAQTLQTGPLNIQRNLAEIAAAGSGAQAAARANLGLSVGTTGHVVPYLDQSNTWGGLQTMSRLYINSCGERTHRSIPLGLRGFTQNAYRLQRITTRLLLEVSSRRCMVERSSLLPTTQSEECMTTPVC